jgi:hypothetical protein
MEAGTANAAGTAFSRALLGSVAHPLAMAGRALGVHHSRDTRVRRSFPMGPGKAGAAEFRHWLDNECKLPENVKESIRVGTRIEKLRSWRGVASYVAKYMSKAVQGGWENVGRYWGIVGRAQMPWSPVGEEFIDYRTAILIRRTARRYLRSKGILMIGPIGRKGTGTGAGALERISH